MFVLTVSKIHVHFPWSALDLRHGRVGWVVMGLTAQLDGCQLKCLLGASCDQIVHASRIDVTIRLVVAVDRSRRCGAAFLDGNTRHAKCSFECHFALKQVLQLGADKFLFGYFK